MHASRPKGMPASVIEVLQLAMIDIAKNPEFDKLLGSLGAEKMSLSPAETTAFVQRGKVAIETASRQPRAARQDVLTPTMLSRARVAV